MKRNFYLITFATTFAMLMVLQSSAFAMAGGKVEKAKPAKAKPAKVESAKLKPAKIKPQSTCPISGESIDKKFYVDANGIRVYACCAKCIAKIKRNPAPNIAKIIKRGETPATTPVTLCKKCGQIKGSDMCCKKNQLKCKKCGLAKGSPGCCKIEKKEKCSQCEQIKGSSACCKAGK